VNLWRLLKNECLTRVNFKISINHVIINISDYFVHAFLTLASVDHAEVRPFFRAILSIRQSWIEIDLFELSSLRPVLLQ
jgi:hypothetical protein